MLIYKILRTEEWQSLRANAETAGAPVDVADGFIHFSTAEQARETAAKHFAQEDGLFLAAFDSDRMGEALKWEPSRGGALFPHLYGELDLGHAIGVYDLIEKEDGGHVFPKDY